MKFPKTRIGKLGVFSASFFSIIMASNVSAQEEVDCDANPNAPGCAQAIDNIVVTGSRLNRSTFTSISPLQIVTTEVSKEAGLINPADILQDNAAATGQQIDLTLSGFVIDNGPGAQTVSLRNLGDNRTLVLINGRRVAPAGIEGAPSAADLSLIPGSLIDSYNILLDGASSVYGSDAVAGVVDAIMRKDFDGFEVDYFGSYPGQGAGERNVVSFAWGTNTDRGFFGAGLDFEKQNNVQLRDRDATKNCQQPYEIDQNGRIRTQELYLTQLLEQENPDNCQFVGFTAGRIIAPLLGSVYYQPNGNFLSNFSEAGGPRGINIDADGDGRTDINYIDYDLNGNTQNADLISTGERISFMSYGEYTFDGEMNLTPYFETIFANRESYGNGGASQLFPLVGGSNPYNPCNPNGLNGVDCGDAYDALLNDPEVVQQYIDAYGDTPANLGLLNGPLGGGATVRPVVSVNGDRDRFEAEIQQFRFVTGIKGDIPALNIGTLSDWYFDVYASYSSSRGRTLREGIRADRLDYSLTTSVIDPVTNEVTCGTGTDGCVPVNLFAPSLYEGIVGDFATQAERDYLFDDRDFLTKYKQSIFSSFMNGTVFELPAGPVLAGFGFTYRKDDIESLPDDVARDGLLFAFFSDGGAVGDKYTHEFYGEIEIPIVADLPGIHNLVTNLSVNRTKDEFYGSDTTYSAKLGYYPTDYLLLRATKGTSFRAPNLRENFLLAQTGFLTLTDPCVIPVIAQPGGVYDPSLDNRNQITINNCIAQGIDPLTFLNGGADQYSMEISTGGTELVGPETSDTFSGGFSFDQPWFEAFDLAIGVTYYTIDIENTIISPTGRDIISGCFRSENNPYCDRISRDGTTGQISLLDAGFFNRDLETIRGLDVNINYAQSVTAFGKPIEVGLDIVANHPKEDYELFNADDAAARTVDNDVGQFGVPKWNANANLYIEFDDWRFSWTTRYLGSVEVIDDGQVPEFSDIFGTSDTCLGPSQGDVQCRDVYFAENYFNHSFSGYYTTDSWSVGFGIRNIFDEEPPRVDGGAVFSINNAPITYGYDLQGRTMFLDTSVSF